MRRMSLLIMLILFFSSFLAFTQETHEECTVGVASGKATVDGRPLLWKNRDTSALNNEINYFIDGRFKYLALVSAGYPDAAWAGVNEMGFCIMNSASNDLPGKSEDNTDNGTIIKEDLQNCITVDDFEAILKRTNASGRMTKANFGVIDAFGGCAFFETGQNSYTKFDANDPEVAPLGYIVRSNFAMTGGGIGGKTRYLRGEELWNRAVIRNKLDYRYILRTVARDLADETGKPYPIPVKGKIDDNPRGTINTYATINRWSTASTALFHGVKPDENPSLTTFWAILGEPIFSIAVPNWVIAESVAPELDGEKYSPICSKVLQIKKANYYDYGRKKRFLKTENLIEIWHQTHEAEDLIFNQTEDILSQWRNSYPKSAEVLDFHLSVANRALATIENVYNEFGVNIDSIRVGVYADFGASDKCVRETIAALQLDPAIHVEKLFGSDIAAGALDNFNAVVFPGGSGSRESCSLGDIGRKKVQQFVDNGGGFIGICAGAYLGSDHPDYDWCLHLADAHIIDRQHYARGGALVQVRLTKEGKKLLIESKDHQSIFSYYHNGPLLKPGNNPNIEDYEALGIFESDVHLESNAPASLMPGSTFLLRSKYGKGKVILCAGHPESTPGIRWHIPRFIRWTTNSNRIDYLANFVNANKFSKEILFDKDWLDKEKNLLRKLIKNNKTEKLNAMKELAAMGSRTFGEWLPGQLRDKSPEIRKYAAEIILEMDYLLAKEDLQRALESEQNQEVQDSLNNVMFQLKTK